MSWPTDTSSPHPAQFSHRWRPVGVALLIGLSLAVAACGTTTGGGGGGGGQPTATPKPSPTATPVPCTTWRLIPSPNGTTYQENRLSAVSALPATDAWAVGGNFGEGGPSAGLIERWDGTSWQIVANPSPDSLGGVAALSATNVWAVGSHGSVSSNQEMVVKTVILHWNGTQWSIVSSPNPTASNTLHSVAALAADDVWAAGEMVTGSQTSQPLIERWDGTAWQVITSPVPAQATASSFTALARIPGTSQLWAVGSVRYGPPPSGGIGYFQPLIERWTGSAWQVITAPTPPSGSLAGSLNGVVALSATDAWAVGDYTASNHTIRPLIAHWDGTRWQIVSSPDAWGSLASVAAAGARDVRAVGHVAIGDGDNQHLLIEQWNGTTWQIMTSPEPSGTRYSLSSVTTDSTGRFWAVGSSIGSAGVNQTLVAQCP